jgi:antitoxin ParD1/3/4
MAADRATEAWLRDKVVAAYAALKAEPTRTVSVEQVRARLAAEHQAATQQLHRNRNRDH